MEIPGYMAEVAANFTLADFEEFASEKSKKPTPYHTNSTYCQNYLNTTITTSD
jgi:hypothetical protein